MSRLRELYKTDTVPAPDETVWLQECNGGSQTGEDHVNMGLGEAIANAKILYAAGRRGFGHHRPASGGYQG